MSDQIALTICQPYASLIFGWDGMPPGIQKFVENRTWNCGYRGPLLIHAGASRAWLNSWRGPVPPDMPFGAIIGQADVVGCERKPFSDRALEHWPWLASHMHAEGPYCIILAGTRRFATPIPYRGQQKMFWVPTSVLKSGVLINA